MRESLGPCCLEFEDASRCSANIPHKGSDFVSALWWIWNLQNIEASLKGVSLLFLKVSYLCHWSTDGKVLREPKSGKGLEVSRRQTSLDRQPQTLI